MPMPSTPNQPEPTAPQPNNDVAPSDATELTLKDVGEDGVLEQIFSVLQAQSAHPPAQPPADPETQPTSASNPVAGPGDLIVGPGDDAAVSHAPGNLVSSVDILTEGADFLPEWFDPYRLGVKAAAQNLADICSMGANPHGLLFALAAPDDTPVNTVRLLAQGLSDEAARGGAKVIGGDLSSSQCLTSTVTALGFIDRGWTPVTRSAAKPGHDVFLAGTVGWAAAGLALLFAGVRLGDDPLLDPFIEVQLAPRPDYESVQNLATWAAAGIDASDGLAGDLGRVARASGVRIRLDEAAIDRLAEPLLPAAEHLGTPEAAREWVLGGGEDHGFLACAPAGSAPVGWTRIGACEEGQPDVLVGDHSAADSAYKHF